MTRFWLHPGWWEDKHRVRVEAGTSPTFNSHEEFPLVYSEDCRKMSRWHDNTLFVLLVHMSRFIAMHSHLLSRGKSPNKSGCHGYYSSLQAPLLLTIKDTYTFSSRLQSVSRCVQGPWRTGAKSNKCATDFRVDQFLLCVSFFIYVFHVCCVVSMYPPKKAIPTPKPALTETEGDKIRVRVSGLAKQEEMLYFIAACFTRWLDSNKIH